MMQDRFDSTPMLVDGSEAGVDELLKLLESLSVGSANDDNDATALFVDVDGTEVRITDEAGLFSAIASLVARGEAIAFRTHSRGERPTKRQRTAELAPKPPLAPPALRAGGADEGGAVVGMSICAHTGLIVSRGDILKQLASGRRVLARVIDESSDVHVGTACGACACAPIVGVLHRCRACERFDLCAKCYGGATDYPRCGAADMTAAEESAYTPLGRGEGRCAADERHRGHSFVAVPHPVVTRDLSFGSKEAHASGGTLAGMTV